MTRYTEGFNHSVTSRTAPIASGWSDGRLGLAPTGKAPPYHGAHPKRSLALPQEIEHWSLTTLREKLVKIGAKVVRHGRYVTFQLAEVAVPPNLFREILRRVDGLRRSPPAAA